MTENGEKTVGQQIFFKGKSTSQKWIGVFADNKTWVSRTQFFGFRNCLDSLDGAFLKTKILSLQLSLGIKIHCYLSFT